MKLNNVKAIQRGADIFAGNCQNFPRRNQLITNKNNENVMKNVKCWMHWCYSQVDASLKDVLPACSYVSKWSQNRQDMRL